MKAIEFVSKISQGKNIEIPKEYISQVSGEFRVIILLETEGLPAKKVRKRTFDAFRVSTKDFKFNRDEIYDE